MLTEEDYQLVATELTVPIAVVKAVSLVESSGVTHWDNGLVPILFEALYFHDYTHGQYDVSHPDISSSYWNQSLYQYGSAEYARLHEAEALNHNAARMSTSWGAFQVMGANWQSLGYASVDELVAHVQTDEGQLDSFVRYIQHNHLENAMRSQNWRAFAEAYNGEGNVDVYSRRMANAYARFAHGLLREGDMGEDVKAVQTALQDLSYYTGSLDGDFGPATREAVFGFQRSKKLTADGIVGDETRKALHIT